MRYLQKRIDQTQIEINKKDEEIEELMNEDMKGEIAIDGLSNQHVIIETKNASLLDVQILEAFADAFKRANPYELLAALENLKNEKRL